MCKKQITTLIPAYAVFPLLSCVAVNFLVYTGISSIADGWKHYDFTTSFDRAVPLMPSFVSVYLGCFLFWVVNYIIIVRQGKEHCMRFVTADIMSRVICCVFFLALPTTNVRPALTGEGIWEQLLQMVYAMDSPTRLFPSIHCLVSWFCYIGIRGNERIPKAYRAFSCIFAVLVCVSTQVTKQHYIVDVFGGIFLAELTYYVARRTNLYRGLACIYDRLYRVCFDRKKK